jgi:hypothetical protein
VQFPREGRGYRIIEAPTRRIQGLPASSVRSARSARQPLLLPRLGRMVVAWAGMHFYSKSTTWDPARVHPPARTATTRASSTPTRRAGRSRSCPAWERRSVCLAAQLIRVGAGWVEPPAPQPAGKEPPPAAWARYDKAASLTSLCSGCQTPPIPSHSMQTHQRREAPVSHYGARAVTPGAGPCSAASISGRRDTRVSTASSLAPAATQNRAVIGVRRRERALIGCPETDRPRSRDALPPRGSVLRSVSSVDGDTGSLRCGFRRIQCAGTPEPSPRSWLPAAVTGRRFLLGSSAGPSWPMTTVCLSVKNLLSCRGPSSRRGQGLLWLRRKPRPALCVKA